MNALLNRQWAELSGEQLRLAFNDLVAINQIEAVALVREYLGDNPDRPVRDFETFYSVISIGIVIHDAWTRDFALNLIFSNVHRIREAALLMLAWSRRGELSLTAQHVDGLIDQIMTSPASDAGNRERAMLLEVSGDRRAVPALLSLVNGPSAVPSQETLELPRCVGLGACRPSGQGRFV